MSADVAMLAARKLQERFEGSLDGFDVKGNGG